MTSRKWTARDMQRALYQHFSDRYAVLFEVTARSWEDDTVDSSRSSRRIDVLLVRRTPKSAASRNVEKRRVTAAAAVLTAGLDAEFIGGDSLFPVGELPAPAEPAPAEPGDDGGLDRLAIEIKVSRPDFLNDVRNPDKQAPWRTLAHRHAYAVPAGLVSVGEVPAASGLLVVGGMNRPSTVSWERRAPRSATARPLTLSQQLDAFYRWSRAEAAAMGLSGARTADTDDPAELRLEIARLRGELQRKEGAVDRLVDQLDAAKHRLAVFEPLPCSTCGLPLRPARARQTDLYLRWEHARADAAACLERRTALAQSERDQWVAEGVAQGKPDRVVDFRRDRPLHVPAPEPVYPGDDTEPTQRLASQPG